MNDPTTKTANFLDLLWTGNNTLFLLFCIICFGLFLASWLDFKRPGVYVLLILAITILFFYIESIGVNKKHDKDIYLDSSIKLAHDLDKKRVKLSKDEMKEKLSVSLKLYADDRKMVCDINPPLEVISKYDGSVLRRVVGGAVDIKTNRVVYNCNSDYVRESNN